MANIIKVKRGSGVPASLNDGELGVDMDNGNVYIGITSGVHHINPSAGASGYSYFPIWAEENADLGTNAFEWAFGNGANCPANQGVIIGVDCELISLHISIRGTSTVTVDVLKNGVLQSQSVSTSSSQRASHTLLVPISYQVGDYVNFKSLLGSTASNGGIVTAWFRVPI